MPFNPQEHLLFMGKDKDGKPRYYLPVPKSVVWFRDIHPFGRIDTDIFTVGDMIAVKAVVIDSEGRVLASGMATVRDASQKEATWAGRIIEKAETAAIGRALTHAGFGADAVGVVDSKGQTQQSSAKQAPQVVQKVAGWKQGFMKYWVEQGFDVESILFVLGVNHINDFAGEQKAATDLMIEHKKAAS